MKLPFNLYKIKIARGRSSPEAFLFPSNKDPYQKNSPGDGFGTQLNTPGDMGMAGQPGQGTGFGSNDRKGYPTGISSFGEEVNNDDIPSDTDPDSPFNSESFDSEKSEYSTGIVTDYGLEIHDSNGTREDSALGRHQTSINKIDDNRDRVPQFYNMHKQKPLFERIRRRNRKD